MKKTLVISCTLFLLCGAGILLVTGATPRPDPVPLTDVYSQFMDQYSDGNAAWKTEITLSADVNHLPKPPYKMHYSDTLGYYTYRVKRFEELSDYERFAVQNDPRLPHFVRERFAKGSMQVLTHPQDDSSVLDAPTVNGEVTHDLVVGPKGVLTKESQNGFVYRFDPEDMITSKSVRLVEVAN